MNNQKIFSKEIQLKYILIVLFVSISSITAFGWWLLKEELPPNEPCLSRGYFDENGECRRAYEIRIRTSPALTQEEISLVLSTVNGQIMFDQPPYTPPYWITIPANTKEEQDILIKKIEDLNISKITEIYVPHVYSGRSTLPDSN